MSLLRVAVVGVGYLGRFHAQKVKQLESELPIRLVGVCDHSLTQAELVGKEFGVPGFSNASDLLGKVDAVTISTVTKSHYEVARLFLRAGVHCNVEKPMTETTEQSRELLKIASEKNLQLCVGHSERFNPAFVRAAKLMQSHHSLEFARHAPYKTRGADVSVVHDLMIHDLSLLLHLVPSGLELVHAAGEALISPSLDWAQATFQFEGNRRAHLSVSRMAPTMTRSLRILGKNESAFCDLQLGEIQWAQFQDPVNPVIENISTGKGDQLLLETRAYLKEVLGQSDAGSIPGREGLMALELVDQVMDQIKAASCPTS